jgi:hypothetical protein
LEEAAVHAGHQVLTEVGTNSALIVGDPQGVLESAAQALPNLLLIYYYYISYLSN